jgi:hypothetical protein
MKRIAVGFSCLFCVLAFSAAGCGGDDDDDSLARGPYLEEWQTVVDGVSFPALAGCVAFDAGQQDFCDMATDDVTCAMAPDDCAWVDSAVSSLAIGGRLSGDNFANRGNVEVYYTNAPGQIRIDMRRFTWASNQDNANVAFERMSFWAYATNPQPPSAEIEELNCAEAWRDLCQVRVYYDGMSQPLRDGADFRVWLPEGWEGDLDVTTEDNDVEDEYPRRGNVAIKGAKGSVDVELGSGNADIEMDPGTNEVPLICDDAQHVECEDVGWSLGDVCSGAAGCEENPDQTSCEDAGCDFAAGCGCVDFGEVKVATHPGRSANITVDVPSDIWGNARLENTEPGLTPSSDPLCLATVECGGIGSCEEDPLDTDKLWKTVVELNDPGDLNVEGAGFSINAGSDACGLVPETEGPAGPGELGDIEDVEKGHIVVCSGCLDIPLP